MLLEFQHGFQISIPKEYEYNGIPPYKGGEPNQEYVGFRDNVRFVVLCGIPDSGKEEVGKQYIRDTDKTAYIRTNNIRERIGLALGEDRRKSFYYCV